MRSKVRHVCLDKIDLFFFYHLCCLNVDVDNCWLHEIFGKFKIREATWVQHLWMRRYCAKSERMFVTWDTWAMICHVRLWCKGDCDRGIWGCNTSGRRGYICYVRGGEVEGEEPPVLSLHFCSTESYILGDDRASCWLSLSQLVIMM